MNSTRATAKTISPKQFNMSVDVLSDLFIELFESRICHRERMNTVLDPISYIPDVEALYIYEAIKVYENDLVIKYSNPFDVKNIISQSYNISIEPVIRKTKERNVLSNEEIAYELRFRDIYDNKYYLDEYLIPHIIESE